MNIAFLAHDKKKELMVQFCTAYKSILSKHTLFATATTGRLIADNTGLPITMLLSHKQGGHQQINARIAYNEIETSSCSSPTPTATTSMTTPIWSRRSATATSRTCPSPPTWPAPKCSSWASSAATWIGARCCIRSPAIDSRARVGNAVPGVPSKNLTSMGKFFEFHPCNDSCNE